MHSRQLQEVRLVDDVPLVADSGHPNRCYAWTGELSWTVAAAIAALLRPGDTFLDVGSFCGQHAMRAARLVGTTGRVVAIEPDPRCLTWLRRNLAAADLSADVEVLEMAAVPDPDVAQVDLRLAGISMSSVTATGSVDGHFHRVDAVHFDRLLAEVQPSLVKIDVEGLDAALLNSSDILKREDAPMLIVELNDGVMAAAEALGYEAVDLRDLVAAADRDLYNVSPDILAYKLGSLDFTVFASDYAAQLSRLRVAPRVRYL